MKIDALTFSKFHDNAAANEDVVAVYPGKFYAVLDGVTSRHKLAAGSLSPGQLAARSATAALHRLAASDRLRILGPSEIVCAINQGVKDAIHACAGSNQQIPAASTLTLVVDRGSTIEIIIV
ncbi:MAG: hypothetical protein ACTSY1_06645, partial [Alphaproteobacteria bacterium]